MSTFDKQLAKIKNDKGFIAALDQSGGSTPKALEALRRRRDGVDGRERHVRRRARDAHADHHEPGVLAASA